MKISQAATYEGDCQLYECSTDPEGIETDAWSIEDGGEKLNLKLIRMSVTSQIGCKIPEARNRRDWCLKMNIDNEHNIYMFDLELKYL